MTKENKKFVDTNLFYERVESVLKSKQITLDTLYKTLNDDIKYVITKNNLSIYLHRPPNPNFLIALCKALNVSSDYLLGLNEDNAFNSEFDLNYDSKRYTKYIHDNYSFYFLETFSNTSTNLQTANLSIKKNVFFEAVLKIKTEDGYIKEYSGQFLLSNAYDIGYITLKGKRIGEIVHLSFHDPVINRDNMNCELFSGAMMSVSAGDIKRSPVLSKFIVLRNGNIDQSQKDALKANLLLNCKYIEIDSENFSDALRNCNFDSELRDKIEERIKHAFNEYKYYKLEESYILNTLSKDFKLSKMQTYQLLNSLRLNSTAKSNCKINSKTDSRLFDFFYKHQNT